MKYCVYDVFTDQAFGGNPLAVVLDAERLTEADLQRVAREFNFSETTFVYPPNDPQHTAKVRIFTPVAELPFAGHPTIGTATALRDLGRGGDEMVLELGVGPIPVSFQKGWAEFQTTVPLKTAAAPSAEDVAACIGLDAGRVRTDRHAPVFAGVGLDFVIAELQSQADLEASSPDLAAFRRTAGDSYDRLPLLVYVRTGGDIAARMFAPLHGVLEDPATGSAAAALSAWLGRLDGVSQSFEIAQGVEMGRPSRISAGVTVESGESVAVTIAGQAVKVMEGRLTF